MPTATRMALDGMGTKLPMPVMRGFRQVEAKEKLLSMIDAMANRLEGVPLVPTPRFVELIPPDISYYIDSSCELGHIAPDTAFFVRHIAPDPVALIEGGMVRPGEVNASSWLEYLRKRDLHLELAYINWRRDHPVEAAAVSLTMRYSGDEIIDHLLSEASIDVANAGHVALTPISALSLPDNFNLNMQVLRRAMGRMTADLRGVSDDTLRSLHTIFRSLERKLDVRHAPLRAEPRWLRKAKRNIVKRSIDALSELLGREPVRLFLGQGHLYLEGKLCNYRVNKLSDARILPTKTENHTSHGAIELTLLRPSDAAEVAKLCIYSQVPLLDHVASLALHIRGGLEEEMLKVGNFYHIDRPVLESLPELAALSGLRTRPLPLVCVDEDEDVCDLPIFNGIENQTEGERTLAVGRNAWRLRANRILYRAQRNQKYKVTSRIVRDDYQPGDEDKVVSITWNEYRGRKARLVQEMRSKLVPAEWNDKSLWGHWEREVERGLIAPRVYADNGVEIAAMLANTFEIQELTEA